MTNAEAIVEQGQLKKITTVEQAVILADEIEIIEAALKIKKDNLKDFIKTNGEITTKDKRWGFNESVSYKFTAAELKAVAQNIVVEGLNPWEMLTISSAKLASLGWKDEYISQLGKRTVTTRFSATKL